MSIFGDQGFIYMMRKYILYFYLLTPLLIFAQTGFGEAQTIDILDFQVTKVFSADLDGDGDMDVLFIAQNINTIAWYENLDGEGSFGAVNYIDQNLNFTQSLGTADFDGDGDLDILATSAGYDRVVWYENLDGQGNFSTQNNIDNNALNAKQAIAADIDGDNDVDVVVAISDENKVVWYENTDGQGNFSSEKIITNNASGVYSIAVSDIDGDSFLDVLANSSSIGMSSWYKNLDGLGNFGSEHIIDLNSTFKIVATDIDGDNDKDLLKMHIINDIVVFHWLENTDGQGTYLQKQLISDAFQTSDFYPTDVDNDGDQDVLVTFVGDGKIAWFENLDGLGTFGERKIVEDLASISIVAADIDGDGYKDIVTSRDDLKNIVWYKNETYLAINENNLQEVVLAPNPTAGTVTIKGLMQPLKSITVYDVFGKIILTQWQPLSTFNISQFPTGMYFVTLNTQNGTVTKKVIKE